VRETLEALLARVEAATGPDRELDAEIMFDLFAKPVGKAAQDGGPRGYLWPEDNPSWAFGMRFPGKPREWFKSSTEDHEKILIERDGAFVQMNSLRVPALTGSIDAVVALVEKMLPGCEWYVWNVARDQNDIPCGPGATLWHDSLKFVDDGCWSSGDVHSGNTPALALIAALLRALIANAAAPIKPSEKEG